MSATQFAGRSPESKERCFRVTSVLEDVTMSAGKQLKRAESPHWRGDVKLVGMCGSDRVSRDIHKAPGSATTPKL